MSTRGLDLEATLATAVAGEHLSGVRDAVDRIDVATIYRIAERIHSAHLAGRTTYCMGNGGSAAIATHLASDLMRLTMFSDGSRPVRVVSLNTNTSLMTACANDHGYEQVFVEQLRGLLEPGDVVIGVSTSGASPNVLNALRFGRDHGAITVGLTGRAGEPLRECADEVLTIESTNVQVIEDVAMVAAHALCLMARARLGGSD